MSGFFSLGDPYSARNDAQDVGTNPQGDVLGQWSSPTSGQQPAGDQGFLGNLRRQLQYAIQWLPKGAIKPMQVQPSATVGDVLTTTANGSEWGSDIWIPKSIGDDKGDLIGFSAADTPVKIAKASGDGYTLTSDTSQTGGVEWLAPPPACHVYNDSATVVTITTAGTYYAVPFASEVFDTDSLHDTATNNHRIQLSRAGYWMVNYGILFLAGTYSGADSFSYTMIARNGNTGTAADCFGFAATRTDTTLGVQQPFNTASSLVYSDGDDWVGIYATNSGISGGTIVSGAAGQRICYAQAIWMRP